MQDPKLIPTSLINSKTIKTPEILKKEKPSLWKSLREKIHFYLEISRIWRRSIAHKFVKAEKAKEYRIKNAQSIKAIFEKRGGLWTKVGQLLSLRTDLFSFEFCDELSTLQDKAYGFPFEDVKRIIEEDLDAPLDFYFDYFEKTPIAAASIGQLHRARLKREQKMVAVKIQRPNIQEIFRRDMALVQKLFSFCTKVGFQPHFEWNDLVAELKQIFDEEIDYRIEKTSVKRMKKNLKKHNIYVPSFHSRYCTQRIMVMEYIEGVFMSDYIKILKENPTKVAAWLEENDVDPKKVANRMILSLNRQLFEDNLFHGDLHPGNIILLRDSRVAFIDFGSVGSMEKEFREKFNSYYKAIAIGDYSKAVDFYFLLMPSLPNIDLQKLKRKLVTFFRNWELRTLTKDLPYDQRSFNGAIKEITQILMPYKVTVEWSFLRISRTLTTLDASIIYLNPEVEYPKLLRRYYRKALIRTRKKQAKTPKMEMLADQITNIQTISQQASELLTFHLENARREAQIFQMTLTKSAAFWASAFKDIALILKIHLLLLTYGTLFTRKILNLDLGLVREIAQRVSSYSPDILTMVFVLNIIMLYQISRVANKMGAKDTRKNTSKSET